jgi:hypothetical protein
VPDRRTSRRGRARKSPQAGADLGAGAEREGFEPPSPFGRSLSRRVHYRSASAPRREAGGRGPTECGRELLRKCRSPRADCPAHRRRLARLAGGRVWAVPRTLEADFDLHRGARMDLGRLRRPRSSRRLTPWRSRDDLLRASARTSGSHPGASLGLTSTFYRGARIRTGDLCVPNAALYRTEPRPGTTPDRLKTNGRGGISSAASQPRSSRFARREPTRRLLRKRVGSHPTYTSSTEDKRTGWDSNPRGC